MSQESRGVRTQQIVNNGIRGESNFTMRGFVANPEFKTLEKVTVIEFSVPHHDLKKKDGKFFTDWDNPTWINFKIIEKNDSKLLEYYTNVLKKGVLVDIRASRFDDGKYVKDGETKYGRPHFKVIKMDVISHPPRDNESDAPNYQRGTRNANRGAVEEEEGGDLPF